MTLNYIKQTFLASLILIEFEAKSILSTLALYDDKFKGKLMSSSSLCVGNIRNFLESNHYLSEINQKQGGQSELYLPANQAFESYTITIDKKTNRKFSIGFSISQDSSIKSASFSFPGSRKSLVFTEADIYSQKKKDIILDDLNVVGRLIYVDLSIASSNTKQTGCLIVEDFKKSHLKRFHSYFQGGLLESLSKQVIAGVAVAVVGFCLVCVVLFYFIYRAYRRKADRKVFKKKVKGYQVQNVNDLEYSDIAGESSLRDHSVRPEQIAVDLREEQGSSVQVSSGAEAA